MASASSSDFPRSRSAFGSDVAALRALLVSPNDPSAVFRAAVPHCLGFYNMTVGMDEIRDGLEDWDNLVQAASCLLCDSELAATALQCSRPRITKAARRRPKWTGKARRSAAMLCETGPLAVSTVHAAVLGASFDLAAPAFPGSDVSLGRVVRSVLASAARSNSSLNGLAQTLACLAAAIPGFHSRRCLLSSIILEAVDSDAELASDTDADADSDDCVDADADAALRGLCSALLAIHATNHEVVLDILPPSGLSTAWIKERVTFCSALREFVASGAPVSQLTLKASPASVAKPAERSPKDVDPAHPAPSAAEPLAQDDPPATGEAAEASSESIDGDLVIARLRKGSGVFVPVGHPADLWIIEQLSGTPGRLVAGRSNRHAKHWARETLGARPYGALLAVGRALDRDDTMVHPDHYLLLLTVLVDRLFYLNSRTPHCLHSTLFGPLSDSVENAARAFRRLLFKAADRAAAGIFADRGGMPMAREDATIVASRYLSMAARAAAGVLDTTLPPEGTVNPATAYYAYIFAFVHSIDVAAPGSPGWFARMPQHPLTFSPAVCDAARAHYPRGVVYEAIDAHS